MRRELQTPALALCIVAASATVAARGAAADADLAWPKATASPAATTAPRDAELAQLAKLCGKTDGALARAATREAARLVQSGELMASDELSFTLRAEGSPQVWPRAWSIEGSLDKSSLEKRFSTWLAGRARQGERRCGIARAMGKDGTPAIAAVMVDALADLTALPTTARVGQWLSLDARMLVPATKASVVLLGPKGAPKTVVASLSDGRIRSTFAVDQPGSWLVQVLAHVGTGPRPVLEARVFAGSTPPKRFRREPAPGESAGGAMKDAAAALAKMVNAARADAGIGALARDATLDKLAREHAAAMAKAKLVGHDLGGGDPTARLKDAGVVVRIAGENVASATSLEAAHRALWASPSHRGNLLYAGFKRVGLAVVRGPRGIVYVAQIFAG